MILFDLLVIFVAAANVFWLPVNRKLPGLLFVVLLAGALLGSNLLADPQMRVVGKGAAIAIYLAVLMLFPHWLAGISREEAAFDSNLRSILGSVRKAQNTWSGSYNQKRDGVATIAQSDAQQAFESALSALAIVKPPSPEWAETVDLLRVYLVSALERASSQGPADGANKPPADEAIRSTMAQLDLAWDRALRVRRFGLPG